MEERKTEREKEKQREKQRVNYIIYATFRNMLIEYDLAWVEYDRSSSQ